MFCSVITINKLGSVNSDVVFDEKTVTFRESLVDPDDILITDDYIDECGNIKMVIELYPEYLGSKKYESEDITYFVSKWESEIAFNNMLDECFLHETVADFRGARNAFLARFDLQITALGLFEAETIPDTFEEFETFISNITLIDWPSTPFI